MSELNYEAILNDPALLKAMLQNPLQLVTGDEREALRRCAVARRFDRVLYEDQLRQPNGVDFETVIGNRFVKRLPGTRQYAVDEDTRRRLLNDWEQDELAALSRSLVVYYREAGEELDTFYHLIVAEPAKARTEIAAAVEAARADYDLNRLFALYQLLEDRRAQLDGKLHDLRRQARARYETYARWATAHYDTLLYQERAQTSELLTTLLAGDAYWLLQLYAQGGMGKTVYVRNVIANYCLPNDAPVAKIDFDYVAHKAAVVREPWRLLLTIADQLNSQLENRPFKSLLDSNRDYMAQDNVDRAWLEQPLAQLTPAESAARQAQIVDYFGSVVGSLPRFLLIFDTLERLRYRHVALEQLLMLLLDLRDRAPGLRVILAGRFDLALPTPGQAQPTAFKSLIGERPQTSETVKLLPFSDEEAAEYLGKKRQIADDELVAAMVEKGDRNPFKLALLAEIVRADASIDAAKIRAYPNADLAYLIERVLLHIEQPWVRWLLRYGVVPRRLTQPFVEQIVLPAVEKLRDGEQREDDPSQDGLNRFFDGDGDPFALSLLREAPPPDLWAQLNEYASDYSWVLPSDEDSQALVFHSDVVNPIRRLLLAQQQEGRHIYQRLQQAAFAHYEALAAQSREAQHLREAVYHLLLAGGEQSAWFALYGAYREDDRLTTALADETVDLATSEAAEIDERVLATAYYELAYRSLPHDRRLSGGEMVRVEERLEQLRRYNGTETIGRAQLAVLDACLLLAQGKAGAVLALLASLQADDDRTRLDFALLEAQALSGLGDDVAIASDDPALGGRVYLSLGRTKEAIEHYGLALEQSRAGGNVAQELQLLSDLGGIYSGAGRAADAVAVFEQVAAIGERLSDSQLRLHARRHLGVAYLTSGDYQQALGSFDQALEIGRATDDRQAVGMLLGNVGAAYHALGDAQAAQRYFGEAQDWQRRVSVTQQSPTSTPGGNQVELYWLPQPVHAVDLTLRNSLGAGARLRGSESERDRRFSRTAQRLLFEQAAREAIGGERLADANIYYRYLLLALLADDEPQLIAWTSIRQIDVLVRLGQEELVEQVEAYALDRLAAAGASEDETRELRLLIQAAVALANWDVQAAQQVFDGITVPLPAAYVVLDLQARVAAANARVVQAVDFWEHAAAAGETPLAKQRALVSCGRLYLQLLDDRPQAQRYLEQAQAAGGDDADVATTLLEVDLLPQRDAQMTLLTERYEAQQTPEARVRLLVRLLVSAGDVAYAVVETLIEQLAQVQPPQARLALLDGLRDCPALTVGEGDARRLVAMLVLPDAGAGTAGALRIAHLQRVLGATEAARQQLDALDVTGRPALLRMVYRAYDQIGWQKEALAQATDSVLALAGTAAAGDMLPQLLALEHLERLAKLDGNEQIREMAAALSDRTIESAKPNKWLRMAIDGLLQRFGQLWAGRLDQLQTERLDRTTDLDERDHITVGFSVSQCVTHDGRKLERAHREETQQRLSDWGVAQGPPPWQFAPDFCEQWQSYCESLADALLAVIGDGDEAQQLTATIPEPTGYLPWELALVDGRPFVMRPDLRTFCRHYEGEQPLEQPDGEVDAVVLRLGSALESIEQRGYSDGGGNIYDLFWQHNVSVEMIEQPTAAELTRALQKLQPKLLYIEANIAETGRGVALDFGSGFVTKGGGRGTIGSGELARALGSMRGAPLIVLDVPGESNTVSNMRQLCLRNHFAAELMRAGHVGSVLAIGLATPNLPLAPPVELLLSELAAGRNLLGVVAQLWRRWAEQIDWEDADGVALDWLLPTAATALFTREPWRTIEFKR